MPTTYDRQTNFTNYQALNPANPLSGSALDTELNAVKLSIDSLIESLALIQRDDGDLANESVGVSQLAASVSLGIEPPTVWTTNTNFFENDTVFYESKLYRALESHLSGTFATDLTAEKWVLFADFNEVSDAAVNVTFTPAGTIAASNVQAAIEEVATDAAAALASLAAMDFLVKTAAAAGSAERAVVDTATIAVDWATAGQAKFGVVADSIGTTQMTDGAATTAKIADSNVTTAKIADSNVTTAKIADSNVTTAKIADSNVTTAKINDAAVTTAKINDAAVTTTKINDAAVTTVKIADSQVTRAKMSSAKFLPQAWLAATISGGTLTVQQNENIASFVKNGTGDWTFTFTTPMANANYSVCYGIQLSSPAAPWMAYTHTKTTTTLRVQVQAGGTPSPADPLALDFQIFGS